MNSSYLIVSPLTIQIINIYHLNYSGTDWVFRGTSQLEKMRFLLENKFIEIRFLNVYTSLILCSLGRGFSPFSLELQ